MRKKYSFGCSPVPIPANECIVTPIIFTADIPVVEVTHNIFSGHLTVRILRITSTMRLFPVPAFPVMNVLKPSRKYNITVANASESAVEKIESAGGKVVVDTPSAPKEDATDGSDQKPVEDSDE